MFRNLFVVLLVCAGQAAFAQGIYSWKDASGRVYYSDNPPPDAKVRTLRQTPLAPARPAADSAGQTPPSYAEKDLAFRQRRAEAAEAEDKARKQQAADEIRQRECTDNRRQLAALESGQRMQRFDANGERVILDADERAAETERTRAAVERACK